MRRLLLAAPLLALVMAGCSPAVTLEPADGAADPACGRVIVALPDSVGGLSIRETNAQGTAAWGEPAGVILRCGVPAPDPTSSECLPVDGVDWIRDDSRDPNFVFTTYGRTPAIEVIIDSDGDPDVENDGVSGVEALTELSNAIGAVPQTNECISPTEAG